MAMTPSDRETIRVMVVEDHPLMRESLRRVLADSDDIRIVAEFGNGTDALLSVEETTPDVILLDLRLPDLDGLDVLRGLGERSARSKVVVLTGNADPSTAHEAMRSGAWGYLMKDHTGPELLAETVRNARLGLVSLDQDFLAGAVSQKAASDEGYEITPREKQVWVCLAKGLGNADIAKELGISERTVKFHIGNVLSKTGTHSRAEAMALAYQSGIVHIDC